MAPDPTPTWRLPQLRDLTAADFARRHRIVCMLLAGHLPLLVALGLLTGRHEQAALGALLAALLLATAWAPLPRRARACAATAGLLTCSELLVGVTRAPELVFHSFVAVVVVALYSDWLTYALALAVVAGQQALTVGPLPDLSGAAATGRSWPLVHIGFLLAESLVLVVLWHAGRPARVEQARQREALEEDRSSVEAQLARADRIRTDLMDTVCHEFRTPLTGIRGAALTLLQRGERLDDAGRAQLLRAVLEQQERLSRLLENMLTAAQATATDPGAAAAVDAVAAEVALRARAGRPAAPAVSVLVNPGTAARISPAALHQVLANLLDNARQHGAPGAVPILAGGQDERGVWLTVSNQGTTLDAESSRRMFEPFTQVQSGSTRPCEGLGMGLYVVRRLVEVHGGEVTLRSDGGWTTVELRLQPAGPRAGDVIVLPDSRDVRV